MSTLVLPTRPDHPLPNTHTLSHAHTHTTAHTHTNKQTHMCMLPSRWAIGGLERETQSENRRTLHRDSTERADPYKIGKGHVCHVHRSLLPFAAPWMMLYRSTASLSWHFTDRAVGRAAHLAAAATATLSPARQCGRAALCPGRCWHNLAARCAARATTSETPTAESMTTVLPESAQSMISSHHESRLVTVNHGESR